MRFKLGTVALAGLLVLSSCKSKPAETQQPGTQPATSQTQTQPAPQTQEAAQTSATAPAGTPSQAAAAATPQATPVTEAAKPAPPPKPEPLILPEGTVITVRLGEPVGSKTSQPGQAFSATLVQPLSVKDKVVLKQGTNAYGVVTQAHPAGKFKGGAILALELQSIVVGSRTYPISTSMVEQQSKGKGKRTATMVGGGAGAGALIGGIAGGGKGAAIGALVGAGAGTAGAAFTGGDRDIALPAETALSFKLKQPLEVKQ